MTVIFNTIGLIGVHQNPCVAQTIGEIYDMLQDKTTLYVENQTAQSLTFSPKQCLSLTDIAQQCALAIVVGGDGNFLNAARFLSQQSHIPIIGINRGRLGFLTEIKPNELHTRLMAVLQGKFKQESRFMLQGQIMTNHQTQQIVALNEITIHAGHSSRLFQMHIAINGRYAFDQRADGLLIATPTGSTAHALSVGGPIMLPNLPTIELTPISSHSLNSRPLIIDINSQIEVHISHYNDPKPMVSFDGHVAMDIAAKSTVRIQRAPKMVNILHPMDYDYFSGLREKLHWGRLFDS